VSMWSKLKRCLSFDRLDFLFFILISGIGHNQW
jgi:hypothetical protein